MIPQIDPDDERLEEGDVSAKHKIEVINAFYRLPAPMQGRKDIVEEVEHEMSRETARKSLNQLANVGILGKSKVGQCNAYWIRSPLSQWPISDDIDERKFALEQLRNDTGSQFVALGILFMAAGSLFQALWLGATNLGNAFPTLRLMLIVLGLMLAIGGIFVVAAGPLIWMTGLDKQI
jgi:hypothetical protein